MIAASASLSICNRPTRPAREMRARSQFQLARVKRVSASAALDGHSSRDLLLRRAVLASYSDPRAGLHSSSRVTALVQQGVVLLFTLVQLPGAMASGAFSGV